MTLRQAQGEWDFKEVRYAIERERVENPPIQEGLHGKNKGCLKIQPYPQLLDAK